MDPFSRLPWFALRDILSCLPDLSTLHMLSLASPAIRIFLQIDGSFSQVVESIISNPQREKGLYLPVRWFVRAVVLIWWRKYSIYCEEQEEKEGAKKEPAHEHEHEHDTKHPSHHPQDTNPLTRSLPDLIKCLMYNPTNPTFQRFPTASPIWEPLPKDIPPVVLYRLLEYSTRVRRLTHGFFHAMIRNCMNANTLEHLSPDDDNGKAERYYCDGPVVNRSRRPRGRPYKPCDLGSPSWFEEQRILYAVWRVVVFFVLKDAINNVAGLFSPPWSSVHYLYPKSTHIAGFWAEQTSSDEIQMEQLRSVLSWMEKEAGGKEKIQSWMFSASQSPSVLSDSLGYCCPQYRAVNKRHWVWFNAHPVKMLYSRGYSCIRSCILGPTSPLEGGDVFYYRRFGLVFWDSARLNALGFPGRRVGAAKMWFAWSSVLNDDQWEAVIKLQRQRYDRERRSMRTIPR